MNKIISIFTFTLIMFFIAEPIQACATEGLNWAIISLLGTTGGVLTGIIIAIISIVKKAEKHGKIIEK